MPNSLYGGVQNAGYSELYGSAPLSERNQKQASELNLPGYSSNDSIAGSQQEAQSDWANFEDYFNKNRGYAQKTLEAAKGKVSETLGDLDNNANIAQAPNTDVVRQARPPAVAPVVQAPNKGDKAAPGVANPQAPAQYQAKDITSIQQRADVLRGYGQPALQAYGGNLQTVGGQPQQKTDEAKYEDRAGGAPSVDPDEVTPPKTSTPPKSSQPPASTPPANGTQPPAAPSPTPTPANGVPPVAPPAQTAPPAKAAPPDDLTRQRDEAGELLKTMPTGEISDADMQKAMQYDNANTLLAGWGEDDGKDLLQQIYGPDAGAWDAAFMATAGGRDVQRQMAAGVKQSSEQFKKQVLDKANFERGEYQATQDQYNIFNDLLNNQPGGGAGGPGGAPGTPGNQPPNSRAGYDSYASYLDGDGTVMGDNSVKTMLHQIPTMTDPATRALIELGRAGTYKGPTPAEMFRDIFASGFTGSVDQLNTRLAFMAIESQWGRAAAEWLWNNIPEDVWNKEFAGTNQGYIEHVMNNLLKTSGLTFGPMGAVIPSGQNVKLGKSTATGRKVTTQRQ